jgi:hypothetical protein
MASFVTLRLSAEILTLKGQASDNQAAHEVDAREDQRKGVHGKSGSSPPFVTL